MTRRDLTSKVCASLLRLTIHDLKDDGIHVAPRKPATTTGKRFILEWTPEFRKAVDDAKAARPVDIGPYLFCNRRGKCYIHPETVECSGFNSIWQRFMARLVAETDITERFTEHDLRAKAASDADSLEHARQLLGHADDTTIRRHYRRNPERVKPLK